jgi:hypothetical protein
MPHFGEIKVGLVPSNLVVDTSFAESHRVTVTVGGVEYYLPLQLVPVAAAAAVLLEDGTFLLLEDGTNLLLE